MQLAERKKIEQSISLLQEVLGQKSASGSGSAPKITIPGFDQEIGTFLTIGEQLQPEIKELSHILSSAVSLMQQILNYSAVCRKWTEAEQKALQEKFMGYSKRTQAVEKNANFVPHARSVREILSVFFWVFTSTPEFIIKGGIEAADFNAIKFQKNKNQGHNDWWRSIGKAARILEDFTKRQFNMGLMFNSNGAGSWSDLLSGSQPATTAPNVQQHSAPQQHAQQKPTAPKVPKKQLQGLNWLVANSNNDKVAFAPGQIEMKHGIFIENCKDCVITIDDKFKSLQMNNSSNIVLIVNSCVSGVEVMNGQNIQVFIRGASPSLSIDKCQKVRVVLNEAYLNCDVVTSKVSEVNISYQRNGNEAKNFMVAEQLITKWNADKRKFETNVYDKFL